MVSLESVHPEKQIWLDKEACGEVVSESIFPIHTYLMRSRIDDAPFFGIN